MPRNLPIADHPLLGKVPDEEIAEELGCTRQGVAKVRRSLGIQPFRVSKHDKQGIREAILRAVWSRFRPVTRERVYHEVLNDYGTVNDRLVWDLIAELESEDWIARVQLEAEEADVPGYVRRRDDGLLER